MSRVTHQECPPLLFAVAVEPLSITLRTLPVFQGPDDLLLYVTDPFTSIPEIIKIKQTGVPFHPEGSEYKYLGVTVTRSSTALTAAKMYDVSLIIK